METIGQVLGQAFQEKQGDTTIDHFDKSIFDIPVIVTLKEAIDFNCKFREPAPKNIKCEFCGKELLPIGRRHMLKLEIVTWSSFEECQCEKAIRRREEIRLKEERRQKEEEEAARRAEFQARVKKLFDQSKLGARFLNRTFEAFKVTEENKLAFESAKKYSTDFQKFKAEGIGLNFNGAYGTGKTHLAAAITIDLINRGIPVIMGTTITLLGKFKEAYDRRESESEIIDLYSTIDLLIIDDLGKERVNEWVLEKLYLIINNRYENNLPLVITTNYNIEDLTKRLSTNQNIDTAEAITSRLWEMCRGIEMVGADWRKQ
jgi:DNA replication protein DnaC